jgi:hypothetical protein
MQEVRAAKGSDDRIKRLLGAFRFAAQLKAIGSDELNDRETADNAVEVMRRVARELDEIPPGRRQHLATLLDDPGLAVRAAAAASLLPLIPEQAIPVLEDVHERARGTGPGFTAFWALAANKWKASG